MVKPEISSAYSPPALPLHIQDQINGRTLRLSSDELVFRIPEPEDFANHESASSRRPFSPSEHFARIFPVLTKVYGPAIVERHLYFSDGARWLIPLELNEVFFAGVIGDARLGKLEYFPKEQQWYRFDPDDQMWIAVPEEHLQSIWTQLLNACALAMPPFVDTHPLLVFLNDPFRARRLLQLARAHRQAPPGRISPQAAEVTSQAERLKNLVVHFVRQEIRPMADALLPITDVGAALDVFLAAGGFPGYTAKQINPLLADAVKKEYDKALRNDLIVGTGHRRGWKGLSLAAEGNAAPNGASKDGP